MATLHSGQVRTSWWMAASWLAANLLGWIAALFVVVGIGWGLADRIDGALGEAGALFVGWLLGGLLGGALLGILQGGVLRERGVAFGPWVLATALGFGLSLATAMVAILWLFPSNGPDPRATSVMLVAGLILAAAQWVVLRRAVARAWLWVPAGAFALGAVFFCGLVLGGEGREMLAFTVGGLVYGVVTGLVLATLPWPTRVAP